LKAEQKIPQLSKGTLTKLHLLLAFARGAELILLDEPTDGLDPLGVEVFMQALVGLAAEEGITVLFSSHRLNEMEQVADYLCMIHRGKALMNGSLDDLKAACQRVVMVFGDDSRALMPEFAGVGSVRQDGRTLTVLANGAVTSVVRRAEGLGARSVDVQPLSLREMFLELVKGETE
jgi:ABC-2 type transport system ATP-binding protein